jgi:hypothetical protein
VERSPRAPLATGASSLSYLPQAGISRSSCLCESLTPDYDPEETSWRVSRKPHCGVVIFSAPNCWLEVAKIRDGPHGGSIQAGEMRRGGFSRPLRMVLRLKSST